MGVIEYPPKPIHRLKRSQLETLCIALEEMRDEAIRQRDELTAEVENLRSRSDLARTLKVELELRAEIVDLRRDQDVWLKELRTAASSPPIEPWLVAAVDARQKTLAAARAEQNGRTPS